MCRRQKLKKHQQVMDKLRKKYKVINLVVLYHLLLKRGETEDAEKIMAYWDDL
jgi:hypothetical protein